MMDKYTRIRHINNLLFLFYQVLVVSVLCAFRAVSSIMIGLILVVSIIQNKNLQGVWLNRSLKHPFVITCSLFFLFQLIPLAYTHNFYEGWKHVQVKSAVLFIPLCFYSCACIHKVNFHSLMIVYICTLAALLTWCLGVSCYKYMYYHTTTTSVFFYHELVSDLGHHAVQFSIFVFAGLLYLLHLVNRQWYLKNKTIHFSLIAYLILGIVLLASKLVIVFTVIYLAFYLFKVLQTKFHARSAVAIALIAAIVCTSILLLTQNPISRRFNDVMHGNIAIVQQPSFHTRDYFNGVQFRLLQWRFVKEILNEHKAWLFGVTPAAAQPLLNQKYISTHMYTGGPGSTSHGYLDYNTHNQFLESLLQTGIVGLLCFIAICVQLVIMTITRLFDYTNRLLRTLLLLLFAYTFCDSVFETQYGLILFLFMPLLFHTGQAGIYPAKPNE